MSNVRHVALLEQARAALLDSGRPMRWPEMPEEFLLADLQAARARFDEVVGGAPRDDVLNHIFEKFCIGK